MPRRTTSRLTTTALAVTLATLLAACASGGDVEDGSGTGAGSGTSTTIPSGTGGDDTASSTDGSGAGNTTTTSSSTSSAGDGGAGGTGGGGGADPDEPLPYPPRPAMRLKGLQPDFWPAPDEIAGNATGGVAMNLVWAAWEPERRAPPCAPDQEELDGHCYVVDAAVDAAIADWTARGLVVTAVVYGVPAWARTTRPCSPVAPGFEIFCAPDDAADYGRFARMIARRYDGRHGHGRIADFVVHNEVNANAWFDVGCGQGVVCDVSAWLDLYAASFAAAYDGVLAEQPHAKVLVSLDHHFGAPFDGDAGSDPYEEIISGETVLRGLDARVAPRAWRVAYHPYPPNLLAPQFGPDDWPRVTYGNLGTLAGWLRREHPGRPSAWEIHLTESGVNSLAPQSSAAAQADGVCRSLYNALGTPGVESYIYHRMTDHPVETASGLGVGLRDETGAAKPAWSVWALANRDDLDPPQLSCGFEHLPFVRLARSNHPSRGHWASSRHAPPGFTEEQAWHVRRDPGAGLEPLYECRVDQHNLLTKDVGCEGLLPLGPVGFVATAQGEATIPLYRCRVGNDHFVSPDAGCEGQIGEGLLGWVWP